MDIANAVSQWLMTQLELMPVQLLRQAAGLASAQRLINRILGEREADELRALLGGPPADGKRVPTVLLPGLMGSLLASIRGIGTMLWFNPTLIADGHINLLDLNDAGTGDRSPDVEIVPVGIEKLTYLRAILALARETRLYEFPYDWRRNLEWNAGLLHQSILRWSSANPGRRFVLVGHSMGGMVARTYLALYPAEAESRVERVIMVATPLHGAVLPILVFSGETNPAQVVTRLHPDNDVVRFAANLPSSYQLLPAPPALFSPRRPYPANWDLYDARAWSKPAVRQDYLDDARAYHDLIDRSDPQLEMSEIAGCHRRTITDVIGAGDGSLSTDSDYTLVYQDDGPDSGDGTVPLWSTVREGIKTYYVEGGHNALPGSPEVIDAILELTHEGKSSLPRQVPEPSDLLDRLRSVSLIQQVPELRRRIELGELVREDLEKLLFAR